MQTVAPAAWHLEIDDLRAWRREHPPVPGEEWCLSTHAAASLVSTDGGAHVRDELVSELLAG